MEHLILEGTQDVEDVGNGAVIGVEYLEFGCVRVVFLVDPSHATDGEQGVIDLLLVKLATNGAINPTGEATSDAIVGQIALEVGPVGTRTSGTVGTSENQGAVLLRLACGKTSLTRNLGAILGDISNDENDLSRQVREILTGAIAFGIQSGVTGLVRTKTGSGVGKTGQK